MTKAQYGALEKLFQAEVESAMEGKYPIVQSKAKVYRELAEEGLAEEMKITLPGRFPVVITGWTLTLAGHYAYCSTC